MRYEDRHQYHIRLPAIDWQRVMLNIRSCGVPLAQLRKYTKMDERTINRIARGEVKEPRFAQGVAILAIHQRLLPDKHREEIYEKV